MRGRGDSPNEARVSFGSVVVSTFDLGTASIDMTSRERISKRSSVEDFEKLRRQQRPFQKERKYRTVAAPTSQPYFGANDRSRKLQEVRQQIEATMNAADMAIRGASFHLSPPAGGTFTPLSGQLFNVSFPGPKRPLLRRPRTRSMTRISQLHLSQLNLNNAMSRARRQTDSSSSNSCSSTNMQNATFTFGRVTPNTTPDTDTAPKRPTRKRSSDRMTETCVAKGLNPSQNIGLKNATWKMMAQTSNKRSRDCLDMKSFKDQGSGEVASNSLHNATWKMVTRTKNDTWEVPTIPVRKQSKDCLLDGSLTKGLSSATPLHASLSGDGLQNATW